MAISLSRIFRALRHRNFRLFFIGQGLSMMGTWLQQVAMGWLTYRITGSAWLLGVIAFCANAGVLVFGTWAGVIADRVRRRRALYLTQSLMLAQAVVLTALTALGHIEVWHLIVLGAVARRRFRVRHSGPPIAVRATGRRSRRPRERDRAQFVPG